MVNSQLVLNAHNSTLMENRWKLNLAPKALCEMLPAGYAPTLPRGLSITDVFADFMKYLLDCAESYIRDSHALGGSIWDSVKADVIFILSHPNGWGGAEQVTMRKAAVKAKLIPDTLEGHERVLFVTEGEASFNFCVNNGISGDTMKVGMSTTSDLLNAEALNVCRLAKM